MEAQSSCASAFAEREFGGACLKDRRRTACLVRIGEQLVKHPGGTLPAKLRKKDLKACYRLMNQEAVTHKQVLAPHHQQTLARMQAQTDTVLVLHDTTPMDYSGLKSIKTLGPIGNGGGRGYLCHNSLAVVAGSKEVLGLAHQILWKRARPRKKETKKQLRQRRTRESRLWKSAAQAIPAAPAGCRWVDVADRGADITEFLDYEEAAGKHYVVRSSSNRKITLQKGGETQIAKLHDWARALPLVDQRCQEVPAKPAQKGCAAQKARTATVGIAWQKVEIQPPRQARGDERGVPLLAWVVIVKEIDPPAGVEALEWILLTNVAVTNVADAWERVEWYSARWTIEEYHKGMKTGCNIEDFQFTTEEALQPAIAMMSVVTFWLLWLRQVNRRADAETRRATEQFPADHVRLLSQWRYRQVRMDLSVRDFCNALARLGGHQNRRSQGAPGWLTLWRGWTKLQLLLEGARTMRSSRSGKT